MDLFFLRPVRHEVAETKWNASCIMQPDLAAEREKITRSSVTLVSIKKTALIIERAWLLTMRSIKLMKILKHGLDGYNIRNRTICICIRTHMLYLCLAVSMIITTPFRRNVEH